LREHSGTDRSHKHSCDIGHRFLPCWQSGVTLGAREKFGASLMPSCKYLETWQICGSERRQSVNPIDTLRDSGDPAVSCWKLNGFDGAKCKEVLHPARRLSELTSGRQPSAAFSSNQPRGRASLVVLGAISMRRGARSALLAN
jgi:hypothetical protein